MLVSAVSDEATVADHLPNLSWESNEEPTAIHTSSQMPLGETSRRIIPGSRTVSQRYAMEDGN